MPHPEIEKLDKGSSSEQVQAAISACIATEMHSNPDMKNDQAAAICHSMAREKTGKGLAPKE